MTEEQFRRVALSMPEATEGSHMGHPDFRVKGKVFASLWDDGEWGMVKLTPEQQDRLVDDNPDSFVPCKGKWGEGGATQVRLARVKSAMLQPAMLAAWRNTAPKALVKELGGGEPE